MSDRNVPTKRYLRFHGTISRTPPPDTVPTIRQFIPDHWIQGLGATSIWVRGYRMMRVAQSAFEPGSPYIDIGMVRVMALPGPVTYGYVDPPRLFVPTDTQLHVEMESAGDKAAPGPCLLLMAPFGVGAKPGNEIETSQLLDQTAALLVAFQGLNIVHEFLFDNVHALDGTQTEVWTTATIQSPFWLPTPDLREASLNQIHAAGLALQQLSEPERNRIRLSLEWLHRASHLSQVEAFLSYWIAIESLMMKDHRDLASVKRAIERIYGLPAPEAGQRFHIQGLYGIRCRIVHQGERLSISGELLEYVEALYTDLLLDKMGLPAQRRADRVIQANPVPLHSYLP